MIIFDLACEHDHRFEGWFHSTQDYEAQLEQGIIHCPQCESGAVRRIPSAVAIAGTKSSEAPATASPSADHPDTVTAALPAGAQAMAIYQQLVGVMMASSEDVGSRFAEEARRIYYNEAPERPIRGQTTDDEYEALKEEGIDIIRLPVFKKEDLS